MPSKPPLNTVTEVPLAQLKENPENPRTIDEYQLKALKHSMETDPLMLQPRPLIALPDGIVLAGNMRLRAARELGWETLPVFYVELDKNTARTWMLRDNNSYGDYEQAQLAEILFDLAKDGIDLSLTGFTQDRVQDILRDVPAVPDAEPPPPAQGHDVICPQCGHGFKVFTLREGGE